MITQDLETELAQTVKEGEFIGERLRGLELLLKNRKDMRIFKTLFQIEINQVEAYNDQTEAQCKTLTANFASERTNF